jgi:hypothetical protein
VRLSLLLLLALFAAGCGGVREVRTQPPRPAVAVADTAANPDRTALTVTLAIADSMPSEVTALRLRVAALWLQPAGGDWQKRPVDRSVAESGGTATRLLAADVPRRRYDSLAVVLAEPFVTFGPNAGGPLTVADSGLVRVPLALDLAGRSRAELRLRLDPAASLARDSTGAWSFRPRLTLQD